MAGVFAGSRRRLVVLVGAGLALAAPAAATWSIVVVNTRTGEVGIFSATCVRNLNLERVLGLVRVGEGAAAVQFLGDPNTLKRQFIWAGMEQGMSPDEILNGMAPVFSDFESLQIGMASTFGAPRTFTGSNVWDPNFGVQGQVGDLLYAIQGNVITGAPVVLEAEAALLAAEGDLVVKLSAAMEASRAMGGDGRCSCDDNLPGSCGSPPTVPFTKSADVSFVIVARLGDIDGVCNSASGCTNGDYYLQRRVSLGGPNAVDPVTRLLDKVRVWEQGLVQVADQMRTEVTVDREELVADGLSTATVTVRLADRNGDPLTVGGQTLTVWPMHGGTAPAIAGPVTDHGDGTHSFQVTATQAAGIGEWHLHVDDGVRNVLLWPALSLPTAPLADLHASRSEISGATGAEVVLTLNRPGDAGRGYGILGSTSGQVPGTTIQGVSVPLNPDRFYGLTLGLPRGPVFSAFSGTLDGAGRAEARFALPPALAGVLVGTHFDFCALVAPPGGAVITNVESVVVTI
ncbi:hypothetical protein Poly30_03090 [Planctomycetes bacterium Poly30]|uniref:Invasin domain-containing protein n=2 Tax=Saltatorellus ferox TaxID=2528018 RepID=A0A518EL51_9BACT|nr:hypothetical protein Poly30_03090 [Planctomycetes bacterium Poly30]